VAALEYLRSGSSQRLRGKLSLVSFGGEHEFLWRDVPVMTFTVLGNWPKKRKEDEKIKQSLRKE